MGESFKVAALGAAIALVAAPLLRRFGVPV